MPGTSTDHIHQANVRWDEDGQPLSVEFDDVYFFNDGGIDESSYVFLEHNGLPERWRHLDQPIFTIGETGFGTGLNFLISANAWLTEVRDPTARLHFVSAEKYPLNRADLKQALARWPELSPLANELIEQYPPATAGIHRLYLAEKRIVLTLLYGEASSMFASLKGSDHPLFHRQANPRIDAWFLDGFAPARNPDMWTEALFKTIADLSVSGTTFSTYTSAGSVRRNLLQTGFTVLKSPGFGPKREMLYGQMAEPTLAQTQHTDWHPAAYNAKHQPPWYLPSSAPRPESAMVLGGGIAGCTTARALAERGIPVTLIERHNALAREGSGNPQGILYPKLSNNASPLSQFGLMALLFASRYHQQFLNSFGNCCGVLVLPESEKEQSSFEQIAAQYPVELVRLVRDGQITNVAGITLTAKLALFFPQLGWINPPAVCQALADHPLITVEQAEITNLDYQAGKWHALDDDSNIVASAPAAILASAFHSNRFEQTRHLPLKQIRGQISCLPATDTSLALKTVICGEGYLAPAEDGTHTLGATYNINDTCGEVRESDHLTNLQQLEKTDPSAATLFSAVNTANLDGRTAFRCTTTDYLPIAGPAPVLEDYQENYELLRKNARSHIPVAGSYWPGLYLNCGHGSRGMSYAPLCAELLASEICGEVPPLALELRQAVHPGRFIIRDMKRNKDLKR